MQKLLLPFLFIFVLIMSGCNLFNKDDDNNSTTSYTSGIVDSVRFQVLSPTSIRLSWYENFSDEEGFRIDRKIWDGEWHYSIQVVGPNIHTVVDTTADLGKIYYYHVYAFKGHAESVKTQLQYNFDLPCVYNMDWQYYSNPHWIRMYWINQAPWADSIVVKKDINYAHNNVRLGVLPGNATEYWVYDNDWTVYTTYYYTTYFQNHQSQEAGVTFEP